MEAAKIVRRKMRRTLQTDAAALQRWSAQIAAMRATVTSRPDARRIRSAASQRVAAIAATVTKGVQQRVDILLKSMMHNLTKSLRAAGRNPSRQSAAAC